MLDSVYHVFHFVFSTSVMNMDSMEWDYGSYQEWEDDSYQE